MLQQIDFVDGKFAFKVLLNASIIFHMKKSYDFQKLTLKMGKNVEI